MTHRADVTNYLRDHVVGALHVGQLHDGDRLPGIREVARLLGRNTRTVKAAYAALERDGLVEIRGRSGVFVARQEVLGGDTSGEMARWMSGVVAEAWKRRVAVGELPQLVQSFTATRPVRCVLVEVLEDASVALRYELEKEWGFDVRVVAPDALREVRAVDFFAATSFLAGTIHAAVEALSKPLVVLTVHPALKAAIEARIREHSLIVVAVDPLFAERIRVSYSADDPSRVRFVAADDRPAVRRLDPAEPVLLTRAARQRLGTVNLALIHPHSPTLSPETASALATRLIRGNLA